MKGSWTHLVLAQARENHRGKQVTVSAEIHHNSDEDSSEEDDGRYEVPISKRSSRMDKQHQQGDAGDGTHATVGDPDETHLSSEADSDQESEIKELEQESVDDIESDAPTELMALDPNIVFKHRYPTVSSTRKPIQPGQPISTVEDASRAVKTKDSEGSKGQAVQPVAESRRQKQPVPRTYKCAHSNGQVDMVTDMSSRKPNQKQSHGHRNRK